MSLQTCPTLARRFAEGLDPPTMHSIYEPPATKDARMTEAPRIDWDAITEEATQLLSDFIRIDTSNPPGREKAASWARSPT